MGPHTVKQNFRLCFTRALLLCVSIRRCVLQSASVEIWIVNFIWCNKLSLVVCMRSIATTLNECSMQTSKFKPTASIYQSKWLIVDTNKVCSQEVMLFQRTVSNHHKTAVRQGDNDDVGNGFKTGRWRSISLTSYRFSNGHSDRQQAQTVTSNTISRDLYLLHSWNVNKELY